jgi:hypothetical protein
MKSTTTTTIAMMGLRDAAGQQAQADVTFTSAGVVVLQA